MHRASEKDLYSILGVSPRATADEIRNAYIARARVIHPDRFDKLQQPKDWQKANEMMAELNEAYTILKNDSSRSHYDAQRIEPTHKQATPPPPQEEHCRHTSPAFEFGELTPGYAAFASLPQKVQARLLQRQQDKIADQFQAKLKSILWIYVFIAVLLCWFGYLFSEVDSAKWKNDTLLWYGGVTLVVGGLLGWNCIIALRWAKATLKPYFYVTPIYFIRTDFDIVSFRPIWTLKDVAVTHNYQNGSYQRSDVVLKFDGHDESFSLSSKEEVEFMFDRIRTYDERLRTAYSKSDQQYFLKNDDFYGVSRSKVPTVNLVSWGKQAIIYVACILFSTGGLLIAIAANENTSRERWVRHPTPLQYSSRPTPMLGDQPNGLRKLTPDEVAQMKDEVVPRLSPEDISNRVIKPSYPEQPLPFSGNVQTYTSAEQIAPFEIKAARGSHYVVKLVDAYTYLPILSVFVHSGDTVEIEVPLGSYEVRYASGDTWYGYEYLFGPDTSYSKANEPFTFQVSGNQVSGYTITLYKVANGNLRTSTISAAEF